MKLSDMFASNTQDEAGDIIKAKMQEMGVLVHDFGLILFDYGSLETMYSKSDPFFVSGMLEKANRVSKSALYNEDKIITSKIIDYFSSNFPDKKFVFIVIERHKMADCDEESEYVNIYTNCKSTDFLGALFIMQKRWDNELDHMFGYKK